MAIFRCPKTLVLRGRNLPGNPRNSAERAIFVPCIHTIRAKSMPHFQLFSNNFPIVTLTLTLNDCFEINFPAVMQLSGCK